LPAIFLRLLYSVLAAGGKCERITPTLFSDSPAETFGPVSNANNIVEATAITMAGAERGIFLNLALGMVVTFEIADQIAEQIPAPRPCGRGAFFVWQE
jgi:hypothetical protein